MTAETKTQIDGALYLIERAIQTVETPMTNNGTIMAEDYEALVKARKALGEAHYVLLGISNESS